MKVHLHLRRREQESAGFDTHIVDTEREPLVTRGSDDVAEMGLLSPDLDDLKECVRALSPNERRAFLIEMSALDDDPDDNDWGHIGNST